jgi:energy-coupling factor transport system ATP-binding protein
VDLSFRYAGQEGWALKDVCIEIQAGQCVVLAGPSGCGKSTLVKCLNGLVPHFEKGVRAGRALLDGVDLADLPMHRIAQQVGAVFQNPRSQFFTTRVVDEVAFGCENLGLPREMVLRRVDNALDRFHIAPLRQRTIFDLSAGERQKAILAAVYAMGPDTWVLDEPSSNLDSASVEILKTTLESLKQEGKTLIIAEHRCHYLNGLADRIIMLDNGRVASEHPGASFFQKSNTEMNRRGLRWIQEPAAFIGPGQAPLEPGSEERLVSRNLCFRYPGENHDALRAASLAGGGGEIIGLTGANGAGKTTLAMLLSGLFKERGGQIDIDGLARKAKERVRLCRLVLQEADHQLFSESVFKELELGLNGYGHDHGRIMELLDAVGLGEKAYFRPHSLSGGEKQRLAVAAALIAEPAVLILDEPTSGLDAVNMRLMGALLKAAADRGSVVLVATHDAEFIQTCCTKVLRMEKGDILNGKIAPS